MEGSAFTQLKIKRELLNVVLNKLLEGVNPILKKPISCELYPIRVSKLKNGFEKINYHKWNICAPACKKGISLNIPIYKFLKNALIRKFGTDWYNLLTKIVEK